ncbi:MAG: hypothetical protein HY782_21865 [Chloroflexi bacterium]|nr:hypothetical protein [Chloroflexota bacterium]
MTRILCCWEFGGGYGHLFRLRPIGEALAERGSQVIYALRDVERGRPILEGHAADIVQAPVWHVPPRAHPLSQTYAQNLWRNGYWHGESLKNQLQGWLALFDAYRPDLILAEHAPSALLAARKAGLPRAAIGTGFSLPPLTSPIPCLPPWFALPETHLVQSEAKFLDGVNRVLQDLGAAPLAAVAEIFEGAARFLCTWPELDHYGVRLDTRYWSPVIYSPDEIDAPWISSQRDNIFVYLKPQYRFFHPIIEWLRESKQPTLVFAPGLDPAERDALEGDTLTITPHPVNLSSAATRCRLMISHGGHNAGALMLLAGVALFICPMELEQAVWAHRLRAQGLADMVNFFNPDSDIRRNIGAALESPQLAEHVNTFAVKYRHFDSNAMVLDLATRCLTLFAKTRDGRRE